MGLARADGLDAVVLREATRRAGVTPRAAYRHFKDHNSFVSAVAAEALGELSARLEASVAADGPPVERLVALGRAYIDFAVEQPGLFDVAMFSVSDIKAPVPNGPGSPYQVLLGVINEFVDAGLISSDQVVETASVAWSAVHGFACLVVRGPLRSVKEERVDALAEFLTRHIASSLAVSSSMDPTRRADKNG